VNRHLGGKYLADGDNRQRSSAESVSNDRCSPGRQNSFGWKATSEEPTVTDDEAPAFRVLAAAIIRDATEDCRRARISRRRVSVPSQLQERVLVGLNRLIFLALSGQAIADRHPIERPFPTDDACLSGAEVKLHHHPTMKVA
jgi:hypothetical protein